MKAFVVIGAGYGDEGKGLVTDYLTEKTGSRVVCRFNGGSQAAHTVNRAGYRHVFNTMSSGSLAGADTYLSNQFIVNPYVLFDELATMSKNWKLPRVYCHPSARVTTIFDMAINNILEMSRGDGRHGSCGLGINETVVRCSESKYKLTVADLYNKDILVRKLQIIKNEWVPHRLRQLGLNYIVEKYHDRTNHILLNDDFELHAEQLRKICNHVLPVSTKLNHLFNDTVIFEGAQGLGLDQDLGHFPHVTRSYTGLFGAIHAMGYFDVEEIQPVYVTRAYVTRHGAGPLEHEGEIDSLAHFDATNVPNTWQGSLRFAPLDLSILRHMITKDWMRSVDASRITILPPQVAISCLDQQDTIFSYDANGHHVCHDDPMKFIRYVEDQIGFRVKLASFGPTANDVTNF